jgi:hypothetical protein
MPNEWVRNYLESRLYKYDQVIDYARSNEQPIVNSHIYGYLSAAPFNVELTRSNQKTVQLNRLFGYSDHLVIPRFRLSGSGNVLLLLTAGEDSDGKLKSVALTKSSQACSLC